MPNTVYLDDFSKLYNRIHTQDHTYAVLCALEECKNTGADQLVISKGEYHFWPDMALERLCYISNNDSGVKRIAFPLIGFKNLKIDANGSEFIFHGRVIPFAIVDSENIEISGLNIDYDRPLYAQGEILASSYEHLDIKISKTDHPYRFVDGKIQFYSENWESSDIGNFLEMDPSTLAPAYRAGDDWARSIDAEEITDGVVRFKKKFSKLHQVGNIMVISTEPRWCPGIFITASKNIRLSNINIYHAAAMGVVAQNTGDIKLDKVNVMLREGTNRIVSANADATHFVNCYGTVSVENCIFENQKDDPLNCHGIYTTIAEIVGDESIIVEYHHGQQVGIEIYEPGDTITFINRKSLLGFASAMVKSLYRINEKYLKIELTDKIPESVTKHDAVENRMRMPELVVRNCRMGRNRARGMLITTPKKVVVEGNTIYSPGAGILIEGDANYWFESGAVNDVLIRNNTFLDCLYSPWGKAAIQISPGVSDSTEYEACFHRNIRIENNHFKAFDPSILSGYSVDGLTFEGNTIEQTKTYEPYTGTKALINLRICKNVTIAENKVIGFDEIPQITESTKV